MLVEKKLINENLVDFGRAADMLWLSIGNPCVIELSNNKKHEVTEYAIHFQCQWRFVKSNEILLASHDIYNPYDIALENNNEWNWDIHGREEEQSNIFDVKCLEMKNKCLPLKIKDIYFQDTNDLHIDFDNGIYFDTFIACSRKQEYYRIIDFTDNKSKHFVIFDVD